jgi:hypothetical protein
MLTLRERAVGFLLLNSCKVNPKPLTYCNCTFFAFLL